MIVLVIDDDENARLELTTLLQQNGWRVIAVADAASAIEHLYRRSLPRVILLDRHLPEQGGEQLARELKANPLFRDIPTIDISGSVDHDALLKALAKLRKPAPG